MNHFTRSFFFALIFLLALPSSACFWRKAKQGHNVYECVTSIKDVKILRSELFSGNKTESQVQEEVIQAWIKKSSEMAQVAQNLLIAELENTFYRGAPTYLIPDGVSLKEMRERNAEIEDMGEQLQSMNQSLAKAAELDPQISGETFFDLFFPAGYMFGVTYSLDPDAIEAAKNIKGLTSGARFLLKRMTTGSAFVGGIFVPQIIVAKGQVVVDEKTQELSYVPMLPVRRNEFRNGSATLAQRFTWSGRFFLNPTIDIAFFGETPTAQSVNRKSLGLKWTWGGVWGKDIWKAQQIGGVGLSFSIPTRLSEHLTHENLNSSELNRARTRGHSNEGVLAAVTDTLKMPRAPTEHLETPKIETQRQSPQTQRSNRLTRSFKKIKKFLLGKVGGTVLHWAEKGRMDTIKIAVTTLLNKEEWEGEKIPSIDNFFINFRHNFRPKRTSLAPTANGVQQILSQSRVGAYFFMPDKIPGFVADLFGLGLVLGNGDFLGSLVDDLGNYVENIKSDVESGELSREQIQVEAAKAKALLDRLNQELESSGAMADQLPNIEVETD